MLHIFNQSEPYPDNWVSDVDRPDYFSDSVYNHAAKILGLGVESYPVGYVSRNILKTLMLSLNALKRIRSIDNDLAIVWQGYGVYAVLSSSVLGKRARFVLNTYKVPSNRRQRLRTRINDRFLNRVIKAAAGVITISQSQANSLKPYNPNVLWLPFASDISWWTPGSSDYAFLANHGIRCRDYILIMGDVDREEEITLKAVAGLKYPILRVTRDPKTALAAREAFRAFGITNGNVLVNISFRLLREIYRGARVVVVPAISSVHPAGMTSLTEAMSCGRPVVIRSGMTTEGYVQNGYDAFVLDEWKESSLRDQVARANEADVGGVVGKNARTTVEERLNFHASARRLADFITQLDLAIK